MKLVLFRHGVALDRDQAIKKKIDDALRPLTIEGKKKTEKVAAYLKKQISDVDFIVTSPLLRAKETAKIVAKIYKTRNILTSPELAPECPPYAFAEWLKIHADDSTTVIAVGHEPQLSVFASWSLAGQSQSFIDLKKSGIACLDFESFDKVHESSARLLWTLPAKMIS